MIFVSLHAIFHILYIYLFIHFGGCPKPATVEKSSFVLSKRDLSFYADRCTVTLLRGGPNIQWILVLVIGGRDYMGPPNEGNFFPGFC